MAAKRSHALSKRKRGQVYLVHFATPYKHCKHYIGFTTLDLRDRMARHLTERGAALLRAVTAAGIPFAVVRTWENVAQAYEGELKRRHKSQVYCPVCTGAIRWADVEPTAYNRIGDDHVSEV